MGLGLLVCFGLLGWISWVECVGFIVGFMGCLVSVDGVYYSLLLFIYFLMLIITLVIVWGGFGCA